MYRKPFSKFRTWALAGVAIAAIAGPASAEEARNFTIPSQSLVAALEAFGKQGDKEILFSRAQAEGHATAGVTGAYEPGQALAMLLNGSGLKFRQVNDNTYVVEAADPQSGSAAGDGADAGTVAALIVTAQKREEQIQDVPIAISAFTEKTLEEQKIEGGFDLLKAIPNVTFSKNNFTSYNFSIRGIGTKAVSATTDPGVAVAFNDAALIQNRLFEQEYFDVERVEVLRGPQGTLYGRNATAGVINVISAKPNLQEFAGWLKGEVGNYHSKRVSAMVNVPLVNDRLGIRIAGALTDRQGYDFNDTTKHPVNGRNLWSGRVSIAFNPTDRIRSHLVWERFNEDDNRSRTGKQLCKRDPGPSQIGSAIVGDPLGDVPGYVGFRRGFFSQGCSPVSLYDPTAFQTPNGLALPFVSGEVFSAFYFPIGYNPNTNQGVSLISNDNATLPDPYAGLNQSKDLRVINSVRDPIYRAKADVVQLSVNVDLNDNLALTSQTTYDADQVYSFQDYNRFNTQPVIIDTSPLTLYPVGGGPSPWAGLARNGVFCDPQIGCSSSIAGFDISTAKSKQFLQEVRLASNFSGPVNFTLGANYTRFRVIADYYVMFNFITAMAMTPPFNFQGDPTKCLPLNNGSDPVDINSPDNRCPYIDPNPVESINGEGHNYFRSKNPYTLHSGAMFGEVYWQLSNNLKLTGGLRYTDDHKAFTPVPSQLLLSTSPFGGGDVSRGYPELPAIKQHWGEFTGRLGADWKPDLSFTDQTMVYAFYSRGYKGGGANPPLIGYSKRTIAEFLGLPPGNPRFDRPPLTPWAQNTTPTFKPEFVNAFEVGAKNTLLGGGLTFNADTFFYDYKDYQVSKVVDRSVSNENFDARVWGLEFETMFSPTRNFQLVGNLGYLNTSIGKGARSIDVMNRTQGDPNWVLMRPWMQYPSNCILPKAMVEQVLTAYNGGPYNLIAGCGPSWFSTLVMLPLIDPNTGNPWNPLAKDANGNLLYPQINGGAGIAQDLSGHKLPNSPHWTVNIGAQYSYPFAGSWKATIRADGYWQSQSWARVYNAVNDKLHGWYNANLSLWFENDDGLKIELYAKNILDKSPITDSFINSDDTGLTTNVFTLDPRLIGLSIKKDF